MIKFYLMFEKPVFAPILHLHTLPEGELENPICISKLHNILQKRIDSNSRNRELCNSKLRELIKLRKSWKKTPTVYLIGPYGHGKSSIIDSLLTAIDSYAEVVKWDAPVSSLPSVNGISTPTTMEVTKYTLRTVDLGNPKETVKLLNLVDTRGWAMSPEIIRFMVKESSEIVQGGKAGKTLRLRLPNY